MADDANALMPFQQSRLPSETEYEAMCTAFAETERGRWFLAQYAKRNRNADTTMVIEAIKRIEQAVARQVPSRPSVPIAAALAQSISDLRQRAGQIAAEGGATLEAVRRNAQKMRDVAWTLREWGTDSDLCDELDTLATGIVDGCEKAATPQQRLLALLDEWDVNAPARIAETRPDPKPAAEICAERVAPVETAAAAPPTASVRPVTAAPVAEPVRVSEPAPIPVAVRAPAAPTPVAKPAPAAPAPTPVAAHAPVAPAPVIPAKPVSSSQSLGAALLAQGIIAPRGSDALAPLRRMSQSEKVALFT